MTKLEYKGRMIVSRMGENGVGDVRVYQPGAASRDGALFQTTSLDLAMRWLDGHDNAGRPYAKISELKEGDEIELDSGFTCQRQGVHFVHDDGGRLYFNCVEGRHFLDGQADDGEHCIGIYRAGAVAS